MNTVECRAGIEASLVVDGNVYLQPQVEQEIYQIAIEALNNSLKHSEATSIDVILRKGVEHIQLEIRDNGHGFDPAADITSGGLGLESMRDRAQLLGGDLFITSAMGQGTLVRLDAPLSRPDSSKE